MSWIIHVAATHTSGYNRLHSHYMRPTRQEVAHIVRASVQRVSMADLRARLDAMKDRRSQRTFSVFMDAIAHTDHIVRSRADYLDMLAQDATMWAGGDIHPTCKALDAAAARIVPTWEYPIALQPTLAAQALHSLTFHEAA